MNIIELIIQSAVSGLVGAAAAVVGAIWGARKTLSVHEKQEARRRKIDVLQRIRGGWASGEWQGPINEISVAFNDSDEVKQVFRKLNELMNAREPNAPNQNASLIEQSIDSLICAMHKDIGLREPKEHWEMRGFISYNPS